MKITSCDCFNEYGKEITCGSECNTNIDIKPNGKYFITIIEKGYGRIKEYEDFINCPFCGKKIEVSNE